MWHHLLSYVFTFYIFIHLFTYLPIYIFIYMFSPAYPPTCILRSNPPMYLLKFNHYVYPLNVTLLDLTIRFSLSYTIKFDNKYNH